MAEYRRSEIISGGFIVLSVLIFALFAFKVTGTAIPLFEDSGIECEAFFDNIKTLNSASKVAIGGQKVGAVSEITSVERAYTQSDIDEEKSRLGVATHKVGQVRHMSRVKFRVTDASVRIGEQTSVMIAQEGFIGPFFLALDPGAWAAGGGTLLKDVKTSPVPFPSKRVDSLEDLTARAGPLVDQLSGMLERLDRDLLAPLLDPKNHDKLATMVPNLAAALDSAKTTMTSVQQYLDRSRSDSLQAQLDQLLRHSDETIVLAQSKLKDELVPRLNALLDEGREAVARARAAVDRIDALVAKKQPEVEKIVDNLGAISDNLKAESAALKGRLDDLQAKTSKILVDVDALVRLKPEEVAELLRTMRNALWQFEMAMRKVKANPALLIFGDDEKELEAVPRDDTGLRKSGRAKPYEQRDESGDKK